MSVMDDGSGQGNVRDDLHAMLRFGVGIQWT